jgi:uncharacterized protein YecE (DUF72 family)
MQRLINCERKNLYVGTSGWTYSDWRGRFYPEDLAQRNWLSWYAGRFNATEVNGSFYRTPSLDAVAVWRDQTPAGFRFAWKASKFITHWKRLSDRCAIDLMESRLAVLGPKCGPILFQLPPNFRANRERLETFIALLSAEYRYVFEFRHESWYDEQIFQILREHDFALCISDHAAAPSPWVVTAQHVYVRGHGPAGRYRGKYPNATLQAWNDRLVSLLNEKRTVSCFSTMIRRVLLRETQSGCFRDSTNSTNRPQKAPRSFLNAVSGERRAYFKLFGRRPQR